MAFAVIAVAYAFITGADTRHIPPPNFSNSYAFNDKLVFIKNKKAKVIALGSSMTLNNIDSETIKEGLATDSYLNMGSWGINMKIMFELLNAYCDVHVPEKLVISSNLMDFDTKNISVRSTEVRDFLQSRQASILRYHVNCFSLNYYFNHFAHAKTYKEDRHNYQYLGYDNSGAVLFDANGFNISEKRWSRQSFVNPEKIQYAYFDSIVKLCTAKKIELYFFQSPFRAGMYEQQVQLDTVKINVHRTHIKNLLCNSRQHYVDATTIKWKDSLFVDAAHFNREGARLYTRYCINQLQSH